MRVMVFQYPVGGSAHQAIKYGAIPMPVFTSRLIFRTGFISNSFMFSLNNSIKQTGGVKKQIRLMYNH